MSTNKTPENDIVKRPPVVVVMGHVDHGKSTLLDYIRKSNVVDTEAGGITQHMSAYIVDHKTKEGSQEKITFLDTPGHEAFQKMRLRGADIADIAILIVSAEDGVKPQTLEALKSIQAANIPFIVAINKIDKPGADIARTQSSLIEHEIYIEGMGGDIPWVGISAKSGEGVDDLLDLVALSADLIELTGDVRATATGIVLEGFKDNKRGNTATLIISNGTLHSGMFVVSGTSYAPVRIMEDFAGQPIKEAGLSEPVGIIGFNTIPQAGAVFFVVKNRKEAEKITEEAKLQNQDKAIQNTNLPSIPIMIKADVLGTIDAIKYELDKFESDRISVRVINASVGDITSTDVQNISATPNAIIVGFNVKTDRSALELAKRIDVEIDSFSIIYELADWLETVLKNRTPKKEEVIVTGKAKILVYFSTQKNTHVLGGRLDDGVIKTGQEIRILRRDIEIGKGTLTNLQHAKQDVDSITEGEFGMQIVSKTTLAPGDYIEGFDTIVT